jgi:hypothetical protein
MAHLGLFGPRYFWGGFDRLNCTFSYPKLGFHWWFRLFKCSRSPLVATNFWKMSKNTGIESGALWGITFFFFFFLQQQTKSCIYCTIQGKFYCNKPNQIFLLLYCKAIWVSIARKIYFTIPLKSIKIMYLSKYLYDIWQKIRFIYFFLRQHLIFSQDPLCITSRFLQPPGYRKQFLWNPTSATSEDPLYLK